jgi:hypothetical protein
MAFFKIAFFKTPKMRVYSYTPRYWDPEKERLEERKRAIAKELGVTPPEDVIDPDAPYRPNIKGQMQRHLQAGKRKAFGFKGGHLLALLMLTLIFIAAYFGSGLFEALFTGLNNQQKQEQPKTEQRSKNEDTHYIIPLP